MMMMMMVMMMIINHFHYLRAAFCQVSGIIIFMATLQNTKELLGQSYTGSYT